MNLAVSQGLQIILSNIVIPSQLFMFVTCARIIVWGCLAVEYDQKVVLGYVGTRLLSENQRVKIWELSLKPVE